MTSTALIPRHVFFGNPDRAQVTISPDGQHIAWLAPRDGVLNVWVAPRERPADARPVTADAGRGIRFYAWAYTGGDILYIQDKGGDENWRVYSADIATGEVGDLTPFDGVAAQIIAASHRRPEEIVVALNNRDPQWHDIYRINVTTGDRELLLEHDRFAGVDVDVRTLSETLGHFSAGFTLSTYVHSTPGMKQSAADAIGNTIRNAI